MAEKLILFPQGHKMCEEVVRDSEVGLAVPNDISTISTIDLMCGFEERFPPIWILGSSPINSIEAPKFMLEVAVHCAFINYPQLEVLYYLH